MLWQLVRRIGTRKVNSKEDDRSFGGFSWLCSGDFWQLTPTDGGLCGGIPAGYIQNARKFYPTPRIAHGQHLLWSGPATGTQGVTKLHICKRVQDAWLPSVQDEVLYGRLTEEGHRLLHGQLQFPRAGCRVKLFSGI